ncbi:Reverse transcriptase (RNA-dependent DNA polymerase) family protein, partial [Aduncisulcus paluster]
MKRPGGSTILETTALLDSGATTNFISSDLMAELSIDYFMMTKSVRSTISLADGTQLTSDTEMSVRAQISKPGASTCYAVVTNLVLKTIALDKDDVPIIIGYPTIRDLDLLHLLSQEHPEEDDPDVFSELSDGELADCKVATHLLPRVTPLLTKYLSDFKRRPDTVADVEPFSIRLIQGESFALRSARRLNPKTRAFLNEEVRRLLEEKKIVKSKSPFYSPVVVVPKKNGQNRLCIDFRTLNKITVPYRFPLPRIDEELDSIHGNVVFGCLDLSNGFHLVPIEPLS